MSEDDSFIRQVNEDLRSDQMKSLWDRFGKVLIGIAILIVLATAGTRGYQYWQETQASASGDAFLAALTLAREGDSEGALEALAKLESDGFGSYPVLARMKAASVKAEAGDFQEAISSFTVIGNDSGVPDAIREVARVRAAYLLVDHGSYEDVSGQVEALTTGSNPMRHSAREALGLAAYKAGNAQSAMDWFQMIVDDTQSPQSIVGRANILIDLMTSKGLAQ